MDQKQFEDKVDSLEKSVTRILGILEKDDAIGEIGLVGRQKEIEKKIDDFLVREKIYKNKAKFIGAVASVITSALIFLGKFLFSKLFL